MLNPVRVRIGAQPIIWSNDDFHDLGGKTSLETCLAQMHEAGYVGAELGHKFPKNASELKPILDRFGLSLVSGWHSSYLATNSFKNETQDFLNHMNFLKSMGCKTVIIAECSYRTYHDPTQMLNWDRKEAKQVSTEGWNKIYSGLEEFARIAQDNGMTLSYHHHMGTVVQNLADIDNLMQNTTNLKLLGDTGHLAFAGENPLAVFEKYKNRIGHVHLKNVRYDVVHDLREKGTTFEKAVKAGVFTVPGDGGIDYKPIFQLLESLNYEGWMVVEAEQDPEKAPPLEYAKKGREYIRKTAGV